MNLIDGGVRGEEGDCSLYVGRVRVCVAWDCFDFGGFRFVCVLSARYMYWFVFLLLLCGGGGKGRGEEGSSRLCLEFSEQSEGSSYGVGVVCSAEEA